ncbi:hypothetical protein D3C85_1847850 [compost metagenome]
MVGLLFDVHIGGVEKEGSLQDLVRQSHHRRIPGDILQPFSVVEPRRRGVAARVRAFF